MDTPRQTPSHRITRRSVSSRPGGHCRTPVGTSKQGLRRKITLALAAALVVACAAHAVIGRATLPSRPDTSGPEEVAHSTPSSQWRQGEVPSLFQIDPQWSEEPYAGGTIHANGCGPTCLSMVYVALTGQTDLDPKGMARFSEAQGHTVDGMTAWTLMTDGAASLGLESREVPASADAMREELRAGHPVICSVIPGDFTTTGHFIVLAGIAEDGGIIVRDPNSAQNTERTWDLDRIISQCANAWAFSR